MKIKKRIRDAMVGLALLVQTLTPCYASAQEKQIRVPFPDLTNAQYLGEKKWDMFKSIPGAETTIRGYKKDNQIIAIYTLPNGKKYGFATKDMSSGKISGYWDTDGDGLCDNEQKRAKIMLKNYGYP